jgi:hypothetical protein
MIGCVFRAEDAPVDSDRFAKESKWSHPHRIPLAL